MNLLRSLQELYYSREMFALKRRFERIHFDGTVRRFHKATLANNWAEAVAIGEALFASGRADRRMYPAIARCFYRAGKPEKGEVYIKAYLEALTDKSMETAIAEWRKLTGQDEAAVETEYRYTGGSGNLGMLEHHDTRTGARSLTKILSDRLLPRPQILREGYFYEKIRTQSLPLQSCTPDFVGWSSKTYAGETLYFLTIEKIKGRRPGPDDMGAVVECCDIISGESYDHMQELMKDVPPGGPVVLRLVDRPAMARLMLWRMDRRARKLRSTALESSVRELRRTLLEQGFFRRVDPVKHYALCHSDFHPGNFLLDEETGRCIALDWSNYNLGLKGADYISLFRDRKGSFDEFERWYLSRSDDSEDGRILAVLVMYGIIYRSVINARRSTVLPLLDGFILPAVERIRSMLGKIDPER